MEHTKSKHNPFCAVRFNNRQCCMCDVLGDQCEVLDCLLFTSGKNKQR